MSPDHILGTAFAFRNSKALLTAVELGLFEALAKGPQNAATLTRQLGLNGRGARDFFDALVALKLLDRDADGFYANAADCSVYLDPDQPAYIGDLLQYLNARMYRTWDLLTPALREGAPQCGPAAAGGFADFYKDRAAVEYFSQGNDGWQSLGGAGACKAVSLAVLQYGYRYRNRARLRSR